MTAETMWCSCSTRCGVSRFNGAAARWRRRPQSWPRRVCRLPALQWGRRSMAAETGRAVGVGPGVDLASMGPPLDGGGDLLRHPWREAIALRASMGPPLDGGGDPGGASTIPAVSNWLQWGRRSMAAETRRRRARPATGRGASMGPPLDGGGDPAGSGVGCGSRRQLQWGRRSMAAETHGGERRHGLGRQASMGPPLDGGGDGPGCCRWSGRAWRASMGPPLDGGGDQAMIQSARAIQYKLQWGRRSMAAETSTTGTRSGDRRSRFNGAAARWRRRRSFLTAIGGAFGLLQWGRRSMAAETGLRGPHHAARGQASMGPPLDGGGDRLRVPRRHRDRLASMAPPLDGGGDHKL